MMKCKWLAGIKNLKKMATALHHHSDYNERKNYDTEKNECNRLIDPTRDHTESI